MELKLFGNSTVLDAIAPRSTVTVAVAVLAAEVPAAEIPAAEVPVAPIAAVVHGVAAAVPVVAETLVVAAAAGAVAVPVVASTVVVPAIAGVPAAAGTELAFVERCACHSSAVETNSRH